MRNTNRDFSIKKATKLEAKVFTGIADPAVVQAWMTKIERVFDVMACSDDQKLCLATFLLEEDFHRIFYDAYYPRSYKDARQEEFLKLVQGQMIVVEYQVKFIELSKYAQVLVSNEIDKCRRFENGLREEIRPSSREQTMFRASDSQTMASASSYRPPRRDSRGFRPGVSSSGQFKSRFRENQGSKFSPNTVQQPLAGCNYTQGSFQRSFTPRQGESSTSARFSSCQLCGRSHPGECLKFKEVGICYRCG
ncbi:uncharacterized protein LOC111375282 [Olea europaea var. sylvestris]|uniref:uncharacterized protein LOC111375282 n=1 Tax=Olea europaea var. sylvestris TaxID=158386 RepID=UPI000C1D7188|nr:uncharacterized protein LOC111375282 [Olea europaea var. sylvestris]